MSYSVKYKSPNGLFWHTVKGIISDFFNTENSGVRVFLLSDNTRIEIPQDYIFKFDDKRFDDIKDHMEDEAGGPIKVKRHE
jgi:hypothetical protein